MLTADEARNLTEESIEENKKLMLTIWNNKKDMIFKNIEDRIISVSKMGKREIIFDLNNPHFSLTKWDIPFIFNLLAADDYLKNNGFVVSVASNVDHALWIRW